MKKFRINKDSFATGFQMDFDNGVTVSIQFGEMSRSDKGQNTAEVAVFRDDDWFIADVDKQDLVRIERTSDVMTHCTPEVVAWIINKAKDIK